LFRLFFLWGSSTQGALVLKRNENESKIKTRTTNKETFELNEQNEPTTTATNKHTAM
jgi:hypothetical protein